MIFIPRAPLLACLRLVAVLVRFGPVMILCEHAHHTLDTHITHLVQPCVRSAGKDGHYSGSAFAARPSCLGETTCAKFLSLVFLPHQTFSLLFATSLGYRSPSMMCILLYVLDDPCSTTSHTWHWGLLNLTRAVLVHHTRAPPAACFSSPYCIPKPDICRCPPPVPAMPPSTGIQCMGPR